MNVIVHQITTQIHVNFENVSIEYLDLQTYKNRDGRHTERPNRTAKSPGPNSPTPTPTPTP